MRKLTIKLTDIERTQDRILELRSSDNLMRYYVPIEKGHNEYFTRDDLALEFAELIGSTVKKLD